MFVLMGIITATHAMSQEKEVFNWDSIIDAVIQVESKGDPKAYNKNGDCVGILQITKGVVRQCNIWLKAEKKEKRFTFNDRWDVEKSKEMFIMYQEHYNKTKSAERAFKIWNCGPGYNKTKAKAERYASKCLKYYKK